MRPEEKIFLMLAAGHGSGEAVLEIRDMLRDNTIDFELIFEYAAKNGLAPMIYKNLNAYDSVPVEVTDKFRDAYLHSVRRNILNAEETLRVIRALEGDGIEVIPLKGSIASETVFGDPGVYLASDIDILVRPEDIERAHTILENAGFRKMDWISDEDLMLNHYHFLYQKGNHLLELHWNLAKRYYKIPPDFWLEESATLDYAGFKFKTLSPERYLLYAIFRLFDHGFRPLKFIVFVSGLIRKYSFEIDWKDLMRMAVKFRMERLTVFTLKLVHDMFGTGIDKNILRKKIRGYVHIRNKVLAGIFNEVRKPHLRMFLYTSLLDTPLDLAKIITKRFFPGMGEIRLRYGLPGRSKKAYAYYLMNPFLVLFKKR
jgi:hypothetical protein